MHERYIILHLSLIEKIGPAVVEQLVLKFLQTKKLSLNDLYSMSVKDIMYFAQISELNAQKIVDGLGNKLNFDKEINLIDKFKINWMAITDDEYPAYLKNIHLPPTIIYYKGDKSSFNERAISIVGARKADGYGDLVVKTIIPKLVQQGWIIVSGGAKGIDTMAHQCTLTNYGKTIAVLGSGLLQPYPNENFKLFESISQKGGLVLSSFPLTMFPAPGNFPARNRIISGLSKACVVIQAGKTSGALITAQYALDQAKEVCVVPGNIDNPLSFGCNKLISQGAHLITSADDILYILNDTPINLEQLTITKEVAKNLVKDEPKFSSIQDKILSFCLQPISFDELLIKTNLNNQKLQNILLELTLDDKIKQDFMGLWQSIVI